MADNFNIHEWNRNRLIESAMGDADLKAKQRVDIIASQILKQFPDLDKSRLRFAVSTAMVDLSLEGLLESDDPKVGDELEAGVMGDSVEEGLTGSYKELEDSLKSKLEKLIAKPFVKMGVYLASGQGFGSVDFVQKEDISAPTFEKLMAAIESEGYKVDPKQSRREYDFEDGERDFFPRIKFTWDPLDIDESVSEATKEEENEFHKELDKLVHKTFGHSSDEKKKINEASRARVSMPRFVKDKNNPNFLNVYIDYDLGPGGSSIALGKETMTGQIRRESAVKAMQLANKVAKDLEAKYNLEDIEITDLENGKVRIFAVSDDFIDMDPNMLNEASKGALNYFNDLKYYYQKAFRYLDVEEREEYKQLAKDFFSKIQIDDKVRPVGLEENTTDWPKEVPSRYGEYTFKLVKVMPDRAKYDVIDVETGRAEAGGRIFQTVNQLKASAEDLIKPQGGRQSSQFEEGQLTKGINDKVSKELFKTLKGKTVRYGGTGYKVVDADEYTLKLDPTEPGTRGITVNLNQFNKSGIIQEIIETIKLGLQLDESTLCKRGQDYIKARKAAGEKSSAYLSGRAVKVCKGDINFKGKKQKDFKG